MKKLNYTGRTIKCCTPVVNVGLSLMIKCLFIFSILYTLSESGLTAQDNSAQEKNNPSLVYDEIPVNVIVDGVGNFYLDVLYTGNDLLFVNIQDLFNTLKISCSAGIKEDCLEGFIEDENRTYFIDLNLGQVKVGDNVIRSANRIIKEMGIIYLESSLFEEAFGITLAFNYRALSIALKSKFELPVIKMNRIEKMRSNISKIKGEVVADTLVKRNYHLFKPGMLDWAVSSFQTLNGSTDNQFSLGIGAELLYGEADLSVYYYDRYKFDDRQLQYMWRWVDNDKSIIKQAQVGKISGQTISFLTAPVIGAVIRNSPTTVRKAKGFYTINEFTEPNWTVELYINNVLVDYTKADASGSFVFKVPIVYGFTSMKLKFYGPMGEERIEERTMNVPYTVMPAGEFEYGLSAGVVEDSSLSRFGKAEFNYGVNRFLTVGGGVEYLSSIPDGAIIPYAKITLQPFGKLTINGEYAHGVRTRAILNYYLYKSAVFEIDYTKYVEGQLATRFNAPEELKARLSVPLKFKKINGFAKIDFTKLDYKTFSYNQAGFMVSAYYKQFSANSSAQVNWIENRQAFITSDLSISYRMKRGYTLRPSARYYVSEKRLLSYKLSVEKSLPKGYLTVSYERNFSYNDNFVNLGFKYDLKFARTGLSAAHSKGKIYMSESAQGSVAFGSGNRKVYGSINTSVSKGGISLYPFLDVNNNGIFDKGEKMVKIASVGISGGKPIFSETDSIVRIPDLNSFVSYKIEFNNNDLENIAWRFKNNVYSVLVDPNQFKRVDIPVIAVGEVNGMISMNTNSTLKGIGRIVVRFYIRNSSVAVAETLSESDGYVYYLGLSPGEYIASLDSAQLSLLDFTADKVQIPFKIENLEDGDIADGINFILSSSKNPKAESRRTNTDNAIHIINHEVTEKPVSTDDESFTLQLAAFKMEKNAETLRLKLEKYLGNRLDIINENGIFKLRMAGLKTHTEINETLSVLRAAGITKVWIISLKAKQ